MYDQSQREAVPTFDGHNVVLLDKLKRPNVFEGDVGDSDERRRVVSGVVKGPPKRGSRSSASATEGVVLGKFEGYLLEN